LDKAANSTPEILKPVPISSGRRKSQCFRHKDSGQHVAFSDDAGDALCRLKLVRAKAGEGILHASPRLTNEQVSGEDRVRIAATTLSKTCNRLKTERISTQANANARCTQWHSLCLAPF
jgi:hypothetical protein